MQNSKRLIIVLGPTASGKSILAVKLAKKFKGEVVSADSRQIYKGLDIGSGKITKKAMQGVPHHLLDITSPKRIFTVTQYRKLAMTAINKIQKRNKIPILCGGTGFYIQAVADGIVIPEVKPDWKLRGKLEKKSAKELYKILKRLDPRRAGGIDKNNPRRLIRALEIIMKTKKSIPALKENPLPYPVLMLGVKRGGEELKKLMEKRFFRWLEMGLIKEVENLKKSGLSWEKIEDFGLHYRIISQYLQNKITSKEMIENSLTELRHYAKRQMTWFKRDKHIHWVKTYQQAEKLTKNFL
ncbi:MAG: tRNA (adenosine(37)-N6)-dimethylallyltransferase MiaA [bacterium]|nr:tRNA (adenosine(37)-N6)-dimethylallyltransferase MiaA [bacterium]